MATTIKMPQLGESVTEGTIERWLVKEGDTVEQYDPLFEVVTDKVNAEVPAEIAALVPMAERAAPSTATSRCCCFIVESPAQSEDLRSASLADGGKRTPVQPRTSAGNKARTRASSRSA